MKRISDIPDGCTEAIAIFEALSLEGSETLIFSEPISLPRSANEQIANHLERIKSQTETDNVRFVGISEAK